MRVFILAVALLTLPSTAYAVDGFQGAKWGMSPEEVRAAFPEALCKSRMKRLEDGERLSCRGNVLDDANASLKFTFIDGALRRVDAEAKVAGRAGLQAVIDGLLVKYGEPIVTTTTFPGTTYVRRTWPKEKLTFNYYVAERVSEAILCYEDATYIGAQDADRHESATDAATRAADEL